MRGFTQNRQIGIALPLPVMNRIRRQIGGSACFFLTLSITQHFPFRPGRRATTGLEVVLGEVLVDAVGGQRGRGGKILADQARALCGMSVRSRQALAMYKHTGLAHACSAVVGIANGAGSS